MAMRKTKSGHGSDCGFGGGFSEKKESRNISLHSFFLIDFRHCNNHSHYNDINDRRELTLPFGIPGRVSCRHRIFNLFSLPYLIFLSLSSTCILCTFVQWHGQLHQGIRRCGIYVSSRLNLGIFGTLAFSKCAKVQGVQGGNY